MLLLWSERWRAGALAPAAGPPPDDRELAADLAALRARGAPAGRRPARPASPTARLRAGAAPAGGGDPGPHPAAPPAPRARRPELSRAGLAERSSAELGDHVLIELVALDDVLYAVTVGRPPGAACTWSGHVGGAVREVELARFMLRRLAHGRPAAGAAAALVDAGRRLEAALLGPAVADLDGARRSWSCRRAGCTPCRGRCCRRCAARRCRSRRRRRTWLRARRDAAAARSRARCWSSGPGWPAPPPRCTGVAERLRPDTVVLADGAATADAHARRARRRLDRPRRRARRLPRRQPAVLRAAPRRRAAHRLRPRPAAARAAAG